MIKEYQVTLICETGQYRPVSAIVKADDKTAEVIGVDAFKRQIRTQGITKICQKRYWGSSDLKRYHYTKVKMREYDKEKIEKENAERYEKIKRERGWITTDTDKGEQQFSLFLSLVDNVKKLWYNNNVKKNKDNRIKKGAEPMKLSLDELTALKLVLEFVSVKDLLTSAMNHFAEQEDTHSKDNADLCFKAITSFLK